MCHRYFKKGITITNAFQKILDESGCKPNKICEDKGSHFYNKSEKSWLLESDVKMQSVHNEKNLLLLKDLLEPLRIKSASISLQYQKTFILLN